MSYDFRKFGSKSEGVRSLFAHKVLDENGKLIDDRYEKRVKRFVEEFEWYIEALKNQRTIGNPY